MTAEKMQQRVLDIAAGRYVSSHNEPKIWFEVSKARDVQLKQNEKFSNLEIDIGTIS